MKKISRKGFLKVAAAAAMSGVTASALAACNAGSSSSTAASTGEAIYTPGTYTGTATGIGEVKVTMTFSETAITDVVIDASNETESIGGVAAPTLKDALMAAQSTEIDNISGATITTNAVKKAAASCIEQAMGVHTAGGDTAASSSDEDWLGTEPEIDESKVAKTVDVDVAVVGCGIAGVAACRSVADGSEKVRWRNRLRWASDCGLLPARGLATTEPGRRNSAVDSEVSIFLFCLTLPSPKSKKVGQST